MFLVHAHFCMIIWPGFLRFAVTFSQLTLTLSFQLHPDEVKPNHHWLVHIFDQLDDYGPVYNFWTFLFERLNKVLKSYATNNHVGEVETTFFRAFSRDVALRDLVSITSLTGTS
jgi:hypothetical protein